MSDSARSQRHNVEMLRRQHGAHGSAIGHAAGVDVEPGEVVDHQFANRDVIVDDQGANAPAFVIAGRFLIVVQRGLGVVHACVHLPERLPTTKMGCEVVASA
jgi:hypothetical protein